MSDFPPQPPPPPDGSEPFPPDFVSYQSAGSTYGNAHKQLRLVVRFTYIAAGLDGVVALVLIIVGLVFALVPMGPSDPGGPPQWVFAVVYGPLGVLILIFGIVKLTAASKLRNARPGAWGWGLAAGVLGTCQLFCVSFCLIEPGFGIYTIIVLSFASVRAYLKSLQDKGRPLYY